MDPHQGHAVALGPGFFFCTAFVEGGIVEFDFSRSRPSLLLGICVSVFRVTNVETDSTRSTENWAQQTSVYDWEVGKDCCCCFDSQIEKLVV